MRGKQIPQKKTINLVIKEKSQFRPTRVIPLFLLLAALVTAFAKFAVLDRLDHVAAERAKLIGVLAQQSALEASTADYNEVAAQYRRYASNWMNDSERAAVDRMEVLALVEAELMSVAGVEKFSIADNVLSVNLTGITLDQTSVIVQRLNTYPIVSSVSVYTATNQADRTQPGVSTQVSMVITLSQPDPVRQTQEGGQTDE